MKKNDLYQIAIKLSGIYMVIPLTGSIKDLIGLLLIRSADPSMSTDINLTLILVTILNILIIVLVIWFLVFKTYLIIKLMKLNKNEGEDLIILSASKKGIYETALIFLGCVMVVWNLPDLLFSIRDYLNMKKNGMVWRPYQNQYLIVAGLRIVIGIALLLGADLISTVFSKEIQAQPILVNEE